MLDSSLACINSQHNANVPPPLTVELFMCFHINGVSLENSGRASEYCCGVKNCSPRWDRTEKATMQKTTEATARRCQRRLNVAKTPIALSIDVSPLN